MLSILSTPGSLEVETSPEPVTKSAETEWVIGGAQRTALAFVGIVCVAFFSGVSYLAGKAALQLEPMPAIQINLPQPDAAAPSIEDQFALYQANVPVKASTEPLFVDPAPGKSYIQMAAVEKGVATVFAEGLRAHGLSAFVAPGPDSRIFRVLIGPVSDQQAYKTAKQELDKIGLSTFMRQYEK
jgi:hypothetical protein